MDVSKALEHSQVEGTLLEWMSVHGNLCLALRHPGNTGASRAQVVAMVHRIGKLLVARGLLTPQELMAAMQVETEHGMESFV